jgi:hypothetical protein
MASHYGITVGLCDDRTKQYHMQSPIQTPSSSEAAPTPGRQLETALGRRSNDERRHTAP